MQHNFNVGDYLVTVTTSTSLLVPALTTSTISWNPPCLALPDLRPADALPAGQT